jgi:HSP20 family protein
MRLNQLMHYNPLLTARSLLGDWDLDQLEENLNFHHGLVPAVNIKEKTDHYLVEADIPGMSKKDIKISLDENILTLHGKREFEERKERKNLIRTERFEGEFLRRFTLPETVNPKEISATYKDGVLSITIPKYIKQKKVSHHEIEIK